MKKAARIAVCVLTVSFILSLVLLIYLSKIPNKVELPLNKNVKELGVIVLAHGGSPRWNNEVRKAAGKLADRYPTIVVLGMADATATQKAVDALEDLGVNKIAVIPLYVSSHSELYRQIEFILGLRSAPDPDYVEAMHRAMENPLKFVWKKVTLKNVQYALKMIKSHRAMNLNQQVARRVPLVFLPALDKSPLVGEILAQRALKLSTKPSEESVLIVAHGPLRDDDDMLWTADMESLAEPVRKLGFRSVCVGTMRDDAPEEIKNRAVARLRRLVEECVAKGSRAIVIPLLLAPGGVESEIRHLLRKLPYIYDGNTLLPHVNVEKWLFLSAESAMRKREISLGDVFRSSVSGDIMVSEHVRR